jgi:uncharacterized protein YcbK (DUF882 family)
MSNIFSSISSFGKIGFRAYCLIFILLGMPGHAHAAHDVRTLSLYNTHSGESVTATFRVNGRYLAGGLRQLNWLLRDWRYNTPAEMDPRLYDLLWIIQRASGSRMPVHILSGYRSPMTNALLRRSSSKVAKHSQHITGRAVDFYLPDVSMHYVRAIAMRLQRGGVGYYPHSRRVFLHVDVGGVRAWPRMSRKELLRIFPDGRTVHLPSDSGPLPGYYSAKAEILAQGGVEKSGLTYAYMDAGPITENGSVVRQFINHAPPTLHEQQNSVHAFAKSPQNSTLPSLDTSDRRIRSIPDLLDISPDEAEDSQMDDQEAPSFALPVERPSSPHMSLASLSSVDHLLPQVRPNRIEEKQEPLFVSHDLDVLDSLLGSMQARRTTLVRHKKLPDRRHLATRK